MRDKGLLFLLNDLFLFALSHFVLQQKLLVDDIKATTLFLNLSDGLLNIIQLILQFAVRSVQETVVLLQLGKLSASSSDLCLKLLGFFL